MSLARRMIRAARLDGSLYEEVEHDPMLTGQAMTVVILAAVAAGIGGFSRGLAGLAAVTVAALIGWYLWALMTYWIGTQLLPESQTRADVGQLLRTLGFSSAPGTIRLVGVIPGVADLAFTVGQVWMLVAMVVAVRQALDYTSTWRALGVVVVGWLVQAAVIGLVIRLLRA